MARKKAAKAQASSVGKEVIRKKSAGTVSADLMPAGYVELLNDLKSRVRAAQHRAAVSVNREMIRLYWDIGRLIVERQTLQGWGTSVIDRLAKDLQKAFPGLKGFSPSNISRMRAFFLAYIPDAKNSAQAVPNLKGRKSAQAVPKSAAANVPASSTPGSDAPVPLTEIPWGHNVVLLFKL